MSILGDMGSGLSDFAHDLTRGGDGSFGNFIQRVPDGMVDAFTHGVGSGLTDMLGSFTFQNNDMPGLRILWGPLLAYLGAAYLGASAVGAGATEGGVAGGAAGGAGAGAGEGIGAGAGAGEGVGAGAGGNAAFDSASAAHVGDAEAPWVTSAANSPYDPNALMSGYEQDMANAYTTQPLSTQAANSGNETGAFDQNGSMTMRTSPSGQMEDKTIFGGTSSSPFGSTAKPFNQNQFQLSQNLTKPPKPDMDFMSIPHNVGSQLNEVKIPVLKNQGAGYVRSPLGAMLLSGRL